ncbi:PH domain-containing protein [archaeon]|nr:PH domain-containing protein [archaeon]
MNRPHPRSFYLFWWSYFWSFILIFAFVGIFLVAFSLNFIDAADSFIFTYAGIAIFISFVLSGVWGKLMYNSYSFETSRKSLNVKWGVMRKHSATIPYSRIQNIDINRGIMARILNLSDVWVQTAGISTGRGLYGALRFSEGIIPGLNTKEAEKLRSSLLNKIKGRQGL